MNICVIGCGYVGLVSGACFAEIGNQTIYLDIDEDKISKLKSGKCPLIEPFLPEIIEKNARAGRINFTTSYEEAIPQSELIFICVQTPENKDGSCNLTYVVESAERLSPYLSEDAVVIIKSTVPVGTTEQLENLIASKTSVRFHMANNPEFLREGSAVQDFFAPDRIVIGTKSDFAKEKLTTLYSALEMEKEKILVMDPRSSELVKYASNTMLAMRISFANEIANLCEKLNANYRQVRIGMGMDSRIGPRFLSAGVGFGGSCFPKDLNALIHIGEQVGEPMLLARATVEINNRQAKRLLEKFDLHFKELSRGKVVAIWGLAFKPNTNDMRYAPSLKVIEGLLERKCKINVFEPSGYEQAKKILNNSVTYAENSLKALDGADTLMLITEWPEFSSPDFAKIYSLLREKVVFDGRNIWQRSVVESYGLKYYGVGT